MLHIEFIGVNGAGKSTLYHQSNAYIAERLGYKPGPDKLWLRMVDDLAIQPAAIRDSWALRMLQTLDSKRRFTRLLPANSENNFESLSKAAMQKSELIRQFMLLNASPPGPGVAAVPAAYAHWNLQYFFSLLTCHQSRLGNPDRELLLLDEGFVSLFSEYVVTDNGVDEALLSTLLDDNFRIDHLFHIKAGVDTCLERLDVRGIPAPYQHLSRRELKSTLIRRDADITQVCQRMAETRTRVVEVANDDAPRFSFAALKPHLDVIVRQWGTAAPRRAIRG